MRVALTGGGTGGHIYPCLAVAEALKNRELADEGGHDFSEDKRVELFYIGTTGKLEEDLVTTKHPEIKFLPIKTSALPRSFNPFSYIGWLWEFTLAVDKCKEYIRKNNIDVVFGTGGYGAAPAFAASILTKTPYIIHNLDANVGLANKVFIRDANVLTLAFSIKTFYPKNGNAMVAGNPVSAKFVMNNGEAPEKEEGEVSLLITGGSQGAKSINNMVGRLLPKLTEISKLSITHVTGPKVYDDYVAEFLDGDVAKYPNYRVYPYTHDMHLFCKEADISICRAGAMTIAEMAASRTVPIFIPLPWAANDHQSENAKALEKASAAYVLNQRELDKEPEKGDLALLGTIYELISDESKLNYMKENLRAFAKPEAARNLAELVSHIGSENP